MKYNSSGVKTEKIETIEPKPSKLEEENPFIRNRFEIIYKLIDCGLAAGLVMFGAIVSSGLSKNAIWASVLVFLAAFVTKFSSYWTSQEKEYSHLFSFFSIS